MVVHQVAETSESRGSPCSGESRELIKLKIVSGVEVLRMNEARSTVVAQQQMMTVVVVVVSVSGV